MQSKDQGLRARRETFHLPTVPPQSQKASLVQLDPDRVKESGASETAMQKAPHVPLPVTRFKGEAIVAQTLRWISSAALQSAPQAMSKKDLTPEVQTALVAGRIIIGTNSADDKKLPDALRKTIHDLRTQSGPREAKEAKQSSRDQGGPPPSWKVDGEVTTAQRERHAQHLANFTDDHHPLFRELNTEAAQYYGAHISRHQKILDSGDESKAAHSTKRIKQYQERLQRTHQSLDQIRSALRDPSKVEMAPPTEPGTRRHAEQRVIEHVMSHADSIHEKTQDNRRRDGLPPSPSSRVIIAGTKPPCETCFETEKARSQVAKASGSLPVKIVRFENPAYKAGNLFGPSPYSVSDDSRVATTTQQNMAANRRGAHPAYAASTRGDSPPRQKHIF